MKKEKSRNKKRFRYILTIILFVCFILLFGAIFYMNIIDILYEVIALIISLLVVIGVSILNFKKRRIWRLIGYFLSILLIIGFIFISIYIYNTLGFLFSITGNNYSLNTYNIVVLEGSDYSDITDLENKNIGINDTIDSEAFEKLDSKIAKETSVIYTNYEDMDTLVTALSSNEVEAIILESSELDLLEETDSDTYNNLKIIYSVNIKISISELTEIININTEPFNIYISASDTYGSINSSSRSDVNIILTVNPKTEQILITWVPRDYYVSINNSTYKDKLTHAGIYGIDTSIYAIENILDIDINYYVKVNFTSFMEIVDILDGVTVYNDETFTSIDGITFKQGDVTLDSKTALSFVRERKNVTGGDVGRGKNQVKVLEALIEKALTPSIITKYNSILNSLKGSFTTNMSDRTIISFIKKEISSSRNWSFESNTLTGTDSYEYTYTYKNKKLYVMIPDDEVVEEAHNKIMEVIGN